MTYRLLPLGDSDAVSEFVANHPKGTIFHTPAMCRVLMRAPENDVYAKIACDTSGNIQALLVAVRVSTLQGMASRFASRAVMYAEPICADAGVQAMTELLRDHDTCMKKRTLFAEARPMFASGSEQAVLLDAGYEQLGYRNYELNLASPAESLWAQLNGKCRSDIRRTMKKGLTIREGHPVDDLDLLYSHIKSSYARSGIPLASRDLFEAIHIELQPEQIRFTIAEYEGRSVAAVLHLVFGNRIVYWYCGVERIRGIAANTCLVWDMIQRGANDGLQVFDFAGAGWVGEDYGPGKFKSQFGGDLVHYDRYRKVYAKRSMKLAQGTYGMVRRFLAPRRKH